MVRNPKRKIDVLPLVLLDPKHYGLIAEFEARFKVVPSLVDAKSFAVVGDVVFCHEVRVRGDVRIKGDGGAQRLMPAEVEELVDTELVVSRG